MHTSTYRHTCTHKYIRSHIYFQCFFSNTPELAAHKLFPIKTTFLLLAIADLFRFLTKVEMSADVTFKIWMKANGGRKEWQTDTHQFPSTHQALTKSIWEIQSVTLVKSLLLANAQITQTAHKFNMLLASGNSDYAYLRWVGFLGAKVDICFKWDPGYVILNIFPPESDIILWTLLQHRRWSQLAEMLLDQSVMRLRKATNWWCDSGGEISV